MALLAAGEQRSHGYDLARRTGLMSGTLYPILVRLADGDIVAARWEDEPSPGRPHRHLYRLTPDGAAVARTALRAPAPTRVVGRPAVAG